MGGVDEQRPARDAAGGLALERNLEAVQIEHLGRLLHEFVDVDGPLQTRGLGRPRGGELDCRRGDPRLVDAEAVAAGRAPPSAQPGGEGVVPAELPLSLHGREVA